MNLGGGTHHAGHAFARGYCLFNDVVAALGELRAEGLADRALVIDCDVHQGDGTADLLGPDPHAFTVSLHGARNYPFQRVPSDLDVDLPSGTGDADYLVLDRLLGGGARVCVVLAGGYADDVRDTVDINAATAAVVAARMRRTPHVATRRGWEADRSPT